MEARSTRITSSPTHVAYAKQAARRARQNTHLLLPKSATLAHRCRPIMVASGSFSLHTMTLAAFRSPCTTWFAWRYSTAQHTSHAKGSTCESVRKGWGPAACTCVQIRGRYSALCEWSGRQQGCGCTTGGQGVVCAQYTAQSASQERHRAAHNGVVRITIWTMSLIFR